MSAERTNEIDKELKVLQTQRGKRQYTTWIVLLAAIFLGAVISRLSASWWHWPAISPATELIYLFVFGFTIGSAMKLYSLLNSERLESKIARLQREKEIEQLLPGHPLPITATDTELAAPQQLAEGPSDYLDRLVAINLKNLDDDYALVTSQARNSFVAAISCGFVGILLFAAVLAGGIINGKSGQWTTTLLQLLPGAFTQMLAETLLYIYNQSQRQMSHRRQSLLRFQSVLLDLWMLRQTAGGEERKAVLAAVLNAINSCDPPTASIVK